MNDPWSVVIAERHRLATDLAAIPYDAWDTPSLCEGWSVHDVLAHLVDVALTSRLGFVRRMVAARFDFDRDNQTGVDRERRPDPAATLAAWRAVADLRRTPPAPLVTRVVEAVVHGEDVRRPLGIAGEYPSEAVAACLRYTHRTSVSIGGGRQRAERLRLVATDADLVLGDGDEVRGSTLDLLVRLSGRTVAPASFSGPGAPVLLAR